MRLDRALSVYAVGPLRRLRVARAHPGLPILMYHSISEAPEPGISAYYKTNTSPAVFQHHMALLEAQGYTGIDLERGLDLLRSDPGGAARHVVITFDDGFRDFHAEAFPVLEKHQFTATVFLPTGFIGDAADAPFGQSYGGDHGPAEDAGAEGASAAPIPGSPASRGRGRRSFKGTECLTWGEVRELRNSGIRFGSHTVTHPRLLELSWDRIERELCDSKAAIEQRLDEPVTSFAYPYAFPQANREFGTRFRSLLQAVGYESCVTTEIGRARADEDPYRLKRLPANSEDDSALFQAKLDGSYDWLSAPQALLKRYKKFQRRDAIRSGRTGSGPGAHPSSLTPLSTSTDAAQGGRSS